MPGIRSGHSRIILSSLGMVSAEAKTYFILDERFPFPLFLYKMNIKTKGVHTSLDINVVGHCSVINPILSTYILLFLTLPPYSFHLVKSLF